MQTIETPAEMIAQLVQSRKDAGLTQKTVAEKMGVNVRFVQRIEANDGDRAISVMFRYADAIGASLRFESVVQEP